MSLNARIFAVPLATIQKLNSDTTLSSSRYGRGFTGCGDISEEGDISISFNNFETLISTTPFKGSQSSIGSTGSAGQDKSPQNEPEQTTVVEQPKKKHSFMMDRGVDRSPGRRSIALRKKSHFSRYGKNNTQSTVL